MEFADIFMLPGREAYGFLAAKIFTSLLYAGQDLNNFITFFLSLFFWAWVYRVVAALLCKAFGLEGRRDGA